MRRLAALLGGGMAITAAASCNGTTGDELVPRFSAFAAGVAGAAEPFTSGGFRVQLTTAKMHIGAVYFDESPPSTGAESPICIASGVYAAQVPGPVDVDLLSTTPQQFSVYGNGSADTAVSWQIWLTDGDVNASNRAHMVDLEGVATRVSDGAQFSFGAVVSINGNRLPAASDPSQPGQSPICKQRIIQIGGIDVPFFPGGTLFLTIDPRAWFNLNLDFSTLPAVTSGACLDTDPLVYPLVNDPSAYALAAEIPESNATCGASALPCCVADGGATADDGGCGSPLTCTSSDPAGGVCGPTYCIPDTNFASGPGASQGLNLFTGIQTGGSEAYSVRYSR
jgi:hypothetical protein